MVCVYVTKNTCLRVRVSSVGVKINVLHLSIPLLYFNHVLFKYSTKGLIITALYGIRWGHRVMGFNSPTDNPFIQLAV